MASVLDLLLSAALTVSLCLAGLVLLERRRVVPSSSPSTPKQQAPIKASAEAKTARTEAAAPAAAAEVASKAAPAAPSAQKETPAEPKTAELEEQSLEEKLSSMEKSKLDDPVSSAPASATAASATATSATTSSAAMSDADSDDLLDDALDELDLLDDVADDLLLEEAAAASIVTTKKVVAPPNRSAVPQTWQEALQVLPAAERIHWAQTISRDLTVQSSMPPQANFSSAYLGSQASGGMEDNAVSSLVQGGGVLTPQDPDSLLGACINKSMMVVNKDTTSFAASADLREAFRKQLSLDIKDRLLHHPDEHANVQADAKRFARCAALLA